MGGQCTNTFADFSDIQKSPKEKKQVIALSQYHACENQKITTERTTTKARCLPSPLKGGDEKGNSFYVAI